MPLKFPRLVSKRAASKLIEELMGPAATTGWLAGWLGDEGERLAARHLRRQGFRILARRYRTAAGEIDLIARDGKSIVFVEVKTRRSDAAGQPHEAVDLHKQSQLTRLALAFLKKFRLLEQPARFDVVSIVWESSVCPPEITHYRNAFEPPGRGQMFS
jgi:putative endonuclease